jgi:hypothetical protein
LNTQMIITGDAWCVYISITKSRRRNPQNADFRRNAQANVSLFDGTLKSIKHRRRKHINVKLSGK